MKRVFAILMALCLLLCACGGSKEDTPTTVPTTQATEPAQTTAPTQPEEATDPTEPMVNAPALYYNPLTGEPAEDPWTARPIAITLNNVSAALPHCGISQADIVYECLVEGGLTRCLAIFGDMSDVVKYGSVRSARDCFVDIVQAYDAIFVSAGGSESALSYLSRIGWDHLNAIGSASNYFYRDADRLNSGYSLEHTLFTSGPDLIEAAAAMGFDLTREDGVNYGLTFAEDSVPDGDAANTITFHFWNGGKTTTMNYNSETGLYEGMQYSRNIIDGNTGKIVGFKNVFAIYSETYMQNTYTMMDLTGSGEGYFACGGEIVPILWNRESDSDPFTYTLADGTPLTLGIGSSYIAVLPSGSAVDYK